MKEGEYIHLYWDGEPEAFYIKGHVTEEIAREELLREEVISKSREITIAHKYARWAFADESARSEGLDRVFKTYKESARSSFKVTEVHYVPEEIAPPVHELAGEINRGIK